MLHNATREIVHRLIIHLNAFYCNSLVSNIQSK